jgi:hypothetical protein
MGFTQREGSVSFQVHLYDESSATTHLVGPHVVNPHPQSVGQLTKLDGNIPPPLFF